MHRASLLALCASAACSSAPAAPEPLEGLEGVEIALQRFIGSGLTGPLPLGIDGLEAPASEGDGEDLVVVSFELLHLERVPETDLDSLVLSATFVAAPDRSEPIEPASILAPDASMGRGSETSALRKALAAGAAGRTEVVLREEVVLPRDAAVVLDARDFKVAYEAEFPWRPDPRVWGFPLAFGLHVTRNESGEALELLLALRAPVPRLDYELDRDEALEPLPARTQNERTYGRSSLVGLVPCEEFVVPAGGLQVDGEELAILGKSPFDEQQGRGLVLFVRASSDTSGVTPEERSALRDELEAEARGARELITDERATLSRNRTLVRALEQLRPDSIGRRTLAVLAQAIEARLCNDFALVADPLLFAQLTEELVTEAEELLATTSAEELAWRLERETYALLGSLEPGESLPPELEGVLLRHAGEVGRYPSSIEEGILIAHDLDHFKRYLIQENLVFLEDPDPSSRVRANDWLLKQGVVVEGYEPFGEARERRAAIARFEEAGE